MITPVLKKETIADLNGQRSCSPKVYIILVNWNGWKDTIECLESVYRSEYENYQVIVVDNGSDDDSLEYLKAWVKNEVCAWTPTSNPLRKYTIPSFAKNIGCLVFTKGKAESISLQDMEICHPGNPLIRNGGPLILIEVKSNLGFGRGNNVALRYILSKSDYDYVWFLNNDTVIGPASLSLMVDAAGDHSPVIIGSVLKYYYAPEKIQAYGGGSMSMTTGIVKTESSTKPKRLNHINGASMMIDRHTLDKVGLFDEKIFMYFEETEYCMRAIQKQVSFAVSDAIVFHKLGTLNRKDGNYFAWLNVYQNKFYSFMKHQGPGFWLLCFWGLLIINLCRLKSGNPRRKASLDALVHSLTHCRSKFVE